MPALPTRFAPVVVPYGVLFRQPTWRHARALLVGAILAPGVRTVASAPRILGLARERRFCRYHRVLSRAAWCPRAASRLRLGLLVRAFVPSGPVVLGIDETVERRRGKRIRAKGIYRDAVRSSPSHFVKASGLRWLPVMLLAPIPWAGRVWALPFLTALAPSPRYSAEAGLRHKRLTDRAPTPAAGPPLAAGPRARRGRRLELRGHGPPGCPRAADDGHHAPTLRRTPLHAGAAAPARDERPAAAQRRPAPTALGGAHGRSHALAARHGGPAIARTTPVLLALFSAVTLLATRLVRHGRLPVRTAAWYAKPTPTFSDALAAVRAHWWRWQRSRTSPREVDMVKLPRHVVRRLSAAACYAA